MLSTSVAVQEISFAIKGKLSNANYSSKKGIFIFFINDRLVESVAMKKVIEAVYSDLLPRHTHPFVYLSLTLPSQHVDINVHPTKKEVHFLFESEIMQQLYTALTQKLRTANESRTFYTQTIAVNNMQIGLEIVSSSKGRTNEDNVSHSFNIESTVSAENEEDDEDDVIVMETNVNNKSKNVIIDESYDDDDDIENENDNEDDDDNDNEDDIKSPVMKLKSKVQQKLTNTNTNTNTTNNNSKKRANTNNNPNTNTIAYKLVRSDPTLTKINAFFQPIDTNTSNTDNSIYNASTRNEINNKKNDGDENAISLINENDDNNKVECICEPSKDNSIVGAFARNCKCCSISINTNINTNNEIKLRARMTVINETNTDLASIHALLKEIAKNQSSKMLSMMKAIIFVGVVNHRLAVVQYNTTILLVNYHALCKELFYQLAIRRFAVTEPLVLTSPIDISLMIRAAMDSPEAKWDQSLGLSKEDITTAACATLVEKREMLKEYFNIGVTELGMLTNMPLLLEGYFPLSARLPIFLLRLAVEVDWTEELSCFHSIAIELSNYYAYIQLSSPSTTSIGEISSLSSLEIIENVLLPSLKNHLIPSDNISNTFTPIGSLEQLYKIFERC